MITKKELEARFSITDNTVYKTVQASGLDTSKEQYTEEEIEEYFVPARALLDSGKKYKDVETWANQKRAQSGNEPSSFPSAAPLFSDDFERAAEQQVLEYAEAALEQAAIRAASQMGEMLNKVLGSKRVQQAFIDGMVDAQAFRKVLHDGFKDYRKSPHQEALPAADDETVDITSSVDEEM